MALIARHNEDLEKAKLDIKNQVPDSTQKITTHVADLTNTDATDAAFLEIKKAHGKIGVLINNAGITKDTLILRMSEEDWDRVQDVNLAVMLVGEPKLSGMPARPFRKGEAGGERRCG